MPDDEVKDEIEELVDARLRDLVAERVSQFSEEDMLGMIDKVITRKRIAIQMNPTFTVPKGEPPIAQFNMPAMEPRFDVPQPKVEIIQANNADVLQAIAASLRNVEALLKAPRMMTVERDANGYIKACRIEFSPYK